jgi:hypothetical protein
MYAAIDPSLFSARLVGDWGFKLVIFGVIGEVVAAICDFISEKLFKDFHTKWKGAMRLGELVAGAVLIFGLSLEYKGHKSETNILDANNAMLYDRATRNELARVELERVLFPISFADPAASAAKLSAFSGMEAEVLWRRQDPSSSMSSSALMSVLKDAKWNVHDRWVSNANGFFNSFAVISINVPQKGADRSVLENRSAAATMLQMELISNGIPAAFSPQGTFDATIPAYELIIYSPVKFGPGIDHLYLNRFFTNINDEWYWPPTITNTPNRLQWPTQWFKNSN